MRMMALRWFAKAARQRVMKNLFLTIQHGWMQIAAPILKSKVAKGKKAA